MTRIRVVPELGTPPMKIYGLSEGSGGQELLVALGVSLLQ